MASDPSYDYDVYCERQERAYRALIKGKTCLDCLSCEHPEEPYKDDIGWCLMSDCFVYADNNPADLDCGNFE